MSLETVNNKTITCPHCGHHTHLTIDASNGDQNYYDECANCCQELHLVTHVDAITEKFELDIESDDEQIY